MDGVALLTGVGSGADSALAGGDDARCATLVDLGVAADAAAGFLEVAAFAAGVVVA